jgi:hypothetical protein
MNAEVLMLRIASFTVVADHRSVHIMTLKPLLFSGESRLGDVRHTSIHLSQHVFSKDDVPSRVTGVAVQYHQMRGTWGTVLLHPRLDVSPVTVSPASGSHG